MPVEPPEAAARNIAPPRSSRSDPPRGLQPPARPASVRPTPALSPIAAKKPRSPRSTETNRRAVGILPRAQSPALPVRSLRLARHRSTISERLPAVLAQWHPPFAPLGPNRSPLDVRYRVSAELTRLRRVSAVSQAPLQTPSSMPRPRLPAPPLGNPPPSSQPPGPDPRLAALVARLPPGAPPQPRPPHETPWPEGLLLLSFRFRPTMPPPAHSRASWACLQESRKP